MMAICSKNSKWFFGFYLLLGPSFLILPPSLLWFHLLETVICLHKIMHRSDRLCYPEEPSNRIVSIPDDSYNTSHGYEIWGFHILEVPLSWKQFDIEISVWIYYAKYHIILFIIKVCILRVKRLTMKLIILIENKSSLHWTIYQVPS